ncbi:serine/threonine protein kinase [Loktanella sp. F6476L]|uniref:serine/threonine-protein kinase n=1 Tax=Loktanella sp. F6476L TaxID=2926405 RepID=UPI001FF4B453|nr:serine/threonine-protein kinase [Loktanella sp. F6476L]MCK0120678.1 serine/threonine protein kinase [Loktanella sp. F6476L]
MGNENAAEIGTDEDFVDELKPGTQLMHGQYTIESFLNAGGFGITYLARDSLDRKIVIKECFPGSFCRRSRSIVQARSRAHQKELNSMVRLFVQEAKSLAKLNHPNIVGVHQVFEDNDTAYMALDFVEGRDMLDTLDDPDAVMAPETIKSMLIDVLGAVGFIHSQDILHRDISPDNILIEPSGRPVLIDFGAAREEATKQSRVLSALSVVKDGYSPQEFYIAGSDQNASSDLYALGASFYHFIKGEVPPNSQARLAAIASGDSDPYVPLNGAIPGYDSNFLSAIDKALEVLPKNRVQSAQEWLDMIAGKHLPTAQGSKATVASAVAATAPSSQGKSKVAMLMASAAAIAVVGVGVAFSTGAFDAAEVVEADASATVAETPDAMAEALALVEAATQDAIEESAAVEPAQATDTTVLEAQAQVEAELAALERAAEEERAAKAAEFEALAAENEARRIALAEERATALAIREAAQAEAAARAAVAAEAQAVAEAQAAAAEEARQLAEARAAQEAQDAAEAEARAIAQAEADAAQAAAEEAARVAAVEAAEAARKAEAAALAAATLDTPTPPMDSNELIALAGITGAPEMPATAFAAILAEGPNASGFANTADFVFPETASGFTSVSLALSEAIPAFAPGREIVNQPPADNSFVLSNWTVELPFAAASSSSRVIGNVGPVAPLWVNEGVEIDTVNGRAIANIDGIGDTLKSAIELEDQTELQVSFGIKDAETGNQTEQNWTLPIIQKTALLNGISFETRRIDDAWVTTVTDAPASAKSDLKVGDQLIAYMLTSELVDDRTSMKTIMDRELADGKSLFSFAVNRDGTMWIASLDYAGNAQ